MLGLLSSSKFSASTKILCSFISNICELPNTNENTELKIRIVKLFFKENFNLASERTVTNGQKSFP